MEKKFNPDTYFYFRASFSNGINANFDNYQFSQKDIKKFKKQIKNITWNFEKPKIKSEVVLYQILK